MATITTANFTVTGPGATTVIGTVAYVAASQIATFTPASNLEPNTTYTNYQLWPEAASQPSLQ